MEGGADSLSLKTAGIFSTYPHPDVSNATAFGDQVNHAQNCKNIISKFYCNFHSQANPWLARHPLVSGGSRGYASSKEEGEK